MTQDKALLAIAALLMLLIAERPAFAYIDPGTGSLIYQTALTVLLGLGFVLRRSRASIARFVKRLGGRTETASEPPAHIPAPRD
jgi:hypothetical protein